MKKSDGDDKKRKGAHLMEQMGLGEIEEMIYGNLEDDELEAELAALQADNAPPRKVASKPLKTKLMSINSISELASESLQDISDDEVSSDTDDSDLLAELNALTELNEKPNAVGSLASQSSSSPSPQAAKGSPRVSSQVSKTSPGPSQPDNMVSTLEERVLLYRAASDNAKNIGDSSKQRRLDRGIKTLQDLLKRAKSGRMVNEEEIPPFVVVGSKSGPPPTASTVPCTSAAVPTAVSLPQPSAPAASSAKSPPSTIPKPVPTPRNLPNQVKSNSQLPSSGTESVLATLSTRRNQYKMAAMAAKHSGDINSATNYVRIAKQFDSVISAMKEGKEVDLSRMPPPLPGFEGKEGTPQGAAAPAPTPRARPAASQPKPDSTPATEVEFPPVSLSPEAEKRLYNAPEAPKTVIDALEQRLAKFKCSEDDAKKADDLRKARRMGRIVKQYQVAIKDYKAGNQVGFEELPAPPGFGPIPMEASLKSQPSQPPPAAAAAPVPTHNVPPPLAPTGRAQQASKLSETEIRRRASSQRSSSSRQEQQSAFLRERMQEYKSAALEAKKKKDIELAKKYMRLTKGFEPMIDASDSGLPVDLSKVPPPLNSMENEEDKFVFVSREECEISGDRDEVFKNLEQILLQQLRSFATNAQHFTKVGDVVTACRFQKMEQNCRKDLDSLKNAMHHGDPVPKFHYETRTFSMVQCNTDLGDNDFELSIIRGIQYGSPSGYTPKDLDTYVKFEFPFPNEDPQTEQTETVKGTNNPEYSEVSKLKINRKARSLVRVVEKKSLKCEVFFKRGFLKSDKLLGTVNVKLQPLENKCTVHESYDLMEGRKSVGGKLEVKLRIRDPFKSKQIEEVKEKWLVIDQFLRMLSSMPPSNKDCVVSISLEVLKYEKQQLDKQIFYLKDSLSPVQLQTLIHKSKSLQERFLQQQAALKTGGQAAWHDYIKRVESDIQSYAHEAQTLAKEGNMQKAQVLLTKRKLAEKEVTAFRTRVSS